MPLRGDLCGIAYAYPDRLVGLIYAIPHQARIGQLRGGRRVLRNLCAEEDDRKLLRAQDLPRRELPSFYSLLQP